MLISSDDIKTIISAIAIGISIASLFISRKSWLQSNRPIVTAFITTSIGNNACVFNLIISNTGNRPATNVCLRAKNNDIESLFDNNATEDKKQSTRRCFSKESTIPVLRNGEELETAFGAYTPTHDNQPWLNYDIKIIATIEYSDLEGRCYKSTMPLRLFARNGFAGSTWSTPSNT